MTSAPCLVWLDDPSDAGQSLRVVALHITQSLGVLADGAQEGRENEGKKYSL